MNAACSVEPPGTSSSIPIRCDFTDGTQRNLVAQAVTLAGAWIQSMRPPPAGTVLEVVLCPPASPALAPLRAVVSASRVDPANAHATGFEVLFLGVDEEVLEDLSWLIWGFSRTRPSSPSERRTAPRVPLQEPTVVATVHGHHAGTIRDISMTGALVEFSEITGLSPGDNIAMCLGPPHAELILSAKVARLENDGHRAGLWFDQLSGEAADYLELLILERLNDSEMVSLAI